MRNVGQQREEGKKECLLRCLSVAIFIALSASQVLSIAASCSTMLSVFLLSSLCPFLSVVHWWVFSFYFLFSSKSCSPFTVAHVYTVFDVLHPSRSETSVSLRVCVCARAWVCMRMCAQLRPCIILHMYMLYMHMYVYACNCVYGACVCVCGGCSVHLNARVWVWASVCVCHCVCVCVCACGYIPCANVTPLCLCLPVHHLFWLPMQAM